MAKKSCGCRTSNRGRKTVRVTGHRRAKPRNC